jgi:hypothetical protein
MWCSQLHVTGAKQLLQAKRIKKRKTTHWKPSNGSFCCRIRYAVYFKYLSRKPIIIFTLAAGKRQRRAVDQSRRRFSGHHDRSCPHPSGALQPTFELAAAYAVGRDHHGDPARVAQGKCASPCRIPARVWTPINWPRPSIAFTGPTNRAAVKRAAQDWGWRSSKRLSRRMTGVLTHRARGWDAGVRSRFFCREGSKWWLVASAWQMVVGKNPSVRSELAGRFCCRRFT